MERLVKNNKAKKAIRKVVIILCWLLIWQSAAMLIDNRILLVGPIQTGKAFLENIVKTDFWRIVLHSLMRIGLGFFLALFAGLILGAAAYALPLAEEFLSPLMSAVKSVPAASFVVLLLIWFGSSKLSFFISFLVVLPNIYVNTIAGLQSTSLELLEMARVFRLGKLNRFLYIYRTAMMPYLLSALKISLGMSWKSGVAAEVIGVPRYSLGERLYMSKIYLDTAGLFSWTFTVILLSCIFEKLVLYCVKRAGEWKITPIFGSKRYICSEMGNIELRGVCKAYDRQEVIDDFSCTIKQGGHYCLTAPSGAGKTTLLRLINRIEKPDAGVIEGVPEYIGMVFQEDRLCEEYDVISNIMITAKKTPEKPHIYSDIYKEASRILPEECLTKPVNQLSGGMRRRCSILRAMLSGSDIIIMDEPFDGLDDENRRKTALYILEKLNGRTLIVTTHRDEEAELLKGIKIKLL